MRMTTKSLRRSVRNPPSKQSLRKRSLARLKDQLPLLQEMAECCHSRGKRRKLVSHASKDAIDCLCDCVQNIAVGNVPLTDDEKRKLKYHKGRMSQLLNKKVSYKKKRQILTQSGGFIPLLLMPILGIAGSLIGDAIAGAVSSRK